MRLQPESSSTSVSSCERGDILGSSIMDGLLGSGCGGLVAGLEKEDRGVGADAFLSAFEAEMFGGGGFDGDASGVDAEDGGNGVAHLRDVGSYFGLLGDDNAVNVADTVTVVEEELVAAAEEHFAVDVFVLGVLVGEVFADVAQGGGAEHGVADSMEEYIGIGMAEESEGVGYLNTSQPQLAVGDKLVDVVAYSYAHGVRWLGWVSWL